MSSVPTLMSCCVFALIGMTVKAVVPSCDTRPSGAPGVNGTASLAQDAVDRAELFSLGVDRFLVGRAEAAVAVVDGHR